MNCERDSENSAASKGMRLWSCISSHQGGTNEPIRSLKGFKRISLDPERRRRSSCAHSPRSEFRSPDGTRAVLPGKYQLSIGGSQPGGPGSVLEGHFNVSGTEVLPR